MATPVEILNSWAETTNCKITDSDFPQVMDDLDPLKDWRAKFHYPKKSYLVEDSCLSETDDDTDEECIFLCGHSLGLQVRTTNTVVENVLDNWAKRGTESHFMGDLPAAYCDLPPKEPMAALVGAKKDEIAIMNGTTINLHLLMATFYKPTAARYKILLEDRVFPSDWYALNSWPSMFGLAAESSIIVLKSREGEELLSHSDVLKTIQEEGDTIAVIMLSGVQYHSGQVMDMAAITAAGHEKGCTVGFDLCHAVGNIPLRLHDWDVDFATWCTYKYLNAGAGGIAAIFVHERNTAENSPMPQLTGWWGVKPEVKFKMTQEFFPCTGADRFKVSNSSPVLNVMLLESLKVFIDAGLENIEQKQFLLVGYLEHQLLHFLGPNSQLPALKIITPDDPKQRGNLLSLKSTFPAKELCEELAKRGVLCDFRPPDILRVSACPLYNSFRDMYRFVQILKDILSHKTAPVDTT